MKTGIAFLIAAGLAAAQPIVIRTTTILDGQGHVLKNKEIVVENGRIARIADDLLVLQHVALAVEDRRGADDDGLRGGKPGGNQKRDTGFHDELAYRSQPFAGLSVK